MKKLVLVAGIAALLGGATQAADLPVKAPRAAPVIAPVHVWTGCYLGGNVGGGWGRKSFSLVGPGSFDSHDVDGWIAGGQIGCDYQTARWVLGVEGMFNWTDINGDHVFDPQFARFTTDIDWLASATARLGYAMDRALIYVKGGAAWARDKHAIFDSTTGDFIQGAAVTRSGWTIGGGLEYAFSPNLSAKIEYQFFDFGTRDVRYSLGFTPDIEQDLHTLKVGLNYRFGGAAPVVSRY